MIMTLAKPFKMGSMPVFAYLIVVIIISGWCAVYCCESNSDTFMDKVNKQDPGMDGINLTSSSLLPKNEVGFFFPNLYVDFGISFISSSAATLLYLGSITRFPFGSVLTMSLFSIKPSVSVVLKLFALFHILTLLTCQLIVFFAPSTLRSLYLANFAFIYGDCAVSFFLLMLFDHCLSDLLRHEVAIHPNKNIKKTPIKHVEVANFCLALPFGFFVAMMVRRFQLWQFLQRSINDLRHERDTGSLTSNSSEKSMKDKHTGLLATDEHARPIMTTPARPDIKSSDFTRNAEKQVISHLDAKSPIPEKVLQLGQFKVPSAQNQIKETKGEQQLSVNLPLKDKSQGTLAYCWPNVSMLLSGITVVGIAFVFG